MDVRLEPWSEPALDLLRRINTSQMRHHVGGPEPERDLMRSNDWRLNLATNVHGQHT
jgi:hypothetical protein